MKDESADNGYQGWAILELMGHRKLAGRVCEATVGSAPLLRIDVFDGDDEAPSLTQFYSPGAIYCITPANEDLCRKFAAGFAPGPVSHYELPEVSIEDREEEEDTCP